MVPLSAYLTLSAMLFAIGLGGALTRKNAILVLVNIEIMMNAANLNFIAFWRYGKFPDISGQLFAFFGIVVAGAEVAVGLALVIAIFRFYKSVNVEKVTSLKG